MKMIDISFRKRHRAEMLCVVRDMEKYKNKIIEIRNRRTRNMEHKEDRTQQQAGGSRELCQRFEFRYIRPEEADQAVEIEQICFPPNEACSEKSMKERVEKAAEVFLVAVDKETGRIAGFLNGISTDEESFRDAFFTDVNLYNPNGKNNMLLGLDVRPEYRNQGLAREIVGQYLQREKARGRHRVILTCLDNKVKMYEKMGFHDDGMANSTWGGEEWHEMSYKLV